MSAHESETWVERFRRKAREVGDLRRAEGPWIKDPERVAEAYGITREAAERWLARIAKGER